MIFLASSWLVFLALNNLFSTIKKHRFLRKSPTWVFVPVLGIIANQTKSEPIYLYLIILIIITAISFKKTSIMTVVLTANILLVSILYTLNHYNLLEKLLV